MHLGNDQKLTAWETKVWQMLEGGEGAAHAPVQAEVEAGRKRYLIDFVTYRRDGSELRVEVEEFIERATGIDLWHIAKNAIAAWPETRRFAGGYSRAGSTKAILEALVEKGPGQR